MIEQVKLSELKPHPDNPRTITREKMDKLKDSLTGFNEMTNVRPLVVNSKGQVIGGNMRLQAMLELGWKEAAAVRVKWSEKRQREFMIKDNAGFGQWEWDALANEWDEKDLDEWGLDLWKVQDLEIEDQKDEQVDMEEMNDEMVLRFKFDQGVYNDVKAALNDINPNAEKALLSLLKL